MNKRSRISLLSVVFMIVILACNISVGSDPTQPNLALTITAQALVLQQNGQAPAAVNPPAANDVNPPAAGAANPTATNTPNSPAANNANPPAAGGPVTVTVSVETNCRQGPNISFPSVYSMSVSDVAEVIGKNTFTNYWIIKIPNGGGSICWLWGKYATIKGDASTLAEFATPTPKATATATKTATPTATITSTTNPFAAPSNLQVINKICVDLGNGTTNYTGTITWTDNSNNEIQFSIGLPGSIYLVGPNVTTYNFNVNLSNVSYAMGSTVPVQVSAQNATTIVTGQVTFSCP